MNQERETKWIDIDDIKIDDMQSRMGHWKEDEQDKKLVNSMEGVGQIQDVIVRPLDNAPHTEKYKYGLVAGSRRYHAALKAGIPKVRAVVREMDDEEALLTSISENEGHKPLTMFEKTAAVWKLYRLLRDKEGMEKTPAQKKIARKLYGEESRRRHVARILARVKKIPTKVITLLKKPDERSDREENLLKKFGVPSTYSAGRETIDTIASLAGRMNEDDWEKTDRLLDVVSQGHLWNLSEEKSARYVRNVRDMIEEGKPFEVAVAEAGGEEGEEPLGVEHSYHIPDFHLPSEQYWNYHQKAMKTYRKEEQELIREVYVNWLEKQAEKQGWIP